MRGRIGRFLILSGLLFIAGTTLIPVPQQVAASRATHLRCLVCGDYGGVDVVNNILLFVPFAAGLRLLRYRVVTVLMLGAAVSFGVELLQFTAIPGRDASLSDLLMNTLGSGLGAIIGGRGARLIYPTPREAIRLALFGAIIWLGVQATTAVLLRSWAPSRMAGAWARAVPGHLPFDGRVISAVISGLVVSDGMIPVPPELASDIRGDSLTLDLEIRSGTNGAWWSPVFELLAYRGSVLSVDAVGGDLAFRPPMLAYRVRLQRPALRLQHALSSSPGTPVRVVAGEHGDTLWSRWTVDGVVREARQILGPSLGWTLLLPFKYAFGPEVRLLTGLWIAGWLALIGYWSAGAGVRLLTAASSLAVLLVLGLGIIPYSFGYPTTHWTEWFAAVTGLAIGYAGHQSAAYFRKRCDSPSIKEFC